MPGQLTPHAVENCSGKLATETTVSAQLPAELLWVVLVVGDVPLELVDQADVTQVDVQLDHHPLILLLLQKVVRLRWVTFNLEHQLHILVRSKVEQNLGSNLLLNSCSNGWHKVGRVQVQIVAKDLSKLLGIQHRLVPVPEERVPQLLALDVHVEPDGDEDLRLSSILVHCAGICVIETEGESPHLLVQDPVPNINMRLQADLMRLAHLFLLMGVG